MDKIFCIIVALCLFSLTDALVCYDCSNCDKVNDDTNSETCNFLHEAAGARCLKSIDSAGVVSRSCGNQLTCTFTDAISECTPGNELSCVTCCEGNLCNTAIIRTPITITMLFIAVIILRFLK
ncbi:uncharacterized protein [Antedon mediterranea]|uniref:uncharacterized protein n=1 Tax=Antedon mediterranea TaxID=105859 RepID=UPI003AF421C4